MAKCREHEVRELLVAEVRRVNVVQRAADQAQRADRWNLVDRRVEDRQRVGEPGAELSGRFRQDRGRLLAEQARAIPACRTAAALGAGFGLALKLGPWQD